MKTVTKCSYADKYKAMRKPTCGCFVCEAKWRIKELERSNERLVQLIEEAGVRSKSAGSAANAALYVAQLNR